MFHTAPTTSTTSTQSHHARLVSTNNGGDPAGTTNTLYGDDKRLIHTGPNPLHN